MMKIYRDSAAFSPEAALCRGAIADPAAEAAVAEILKDVREQGDEAVLRYCEKFDGVRPEPLEVKRSEVEAALLAVEPRFLETLRQAAENIRAFHSRQLREGFEMKGQEGVVLGQRIFPLERVGIYIPGGTAAYPSTVLMNAIPAKLAGVCEIIMVTPPKAGGAIGNDILAAAAVAGVDRIFRVGGAQAIGALAFGTKSVPKVDKIVGPGNLYVATAKRQVFGTVSIDMIAGPSEILVIADETCRPENVAADLLSQAEHDRLAAAILLTPSVALAEAVEKEVERRLCKLPREAIARASIEAYGAIVVVSSIKEAIEIANRIAPEHLELCCDEPFSLLGQIRNAGSVFLGKYAPEALGDYFAGPNHTLPTNGTARFSSPLGVDDFTRRSSYLYYTEEALGKVYERVADFAEHEGLFAHAQSLTVRFEEGEL